MSRFQVPLDTWGERDKTAVLRDMSKRIIVDTFTWDVPSILATTTTDTTLTTTDDAAVKGLRAGCFVTVTPPSTLNAGLIVGSAWCAADDTLTVRIRNVSGSTIDQASGTWAYLAVVP